MKEKTLSVIAIILLVGYNAGSNYYLFASSKSVVKEKDSVIQVRNERIHYLDSICDKNFKKVTKGKK